MRKLSLLSTMLVVGLVVGLVGFSFAVDTRAANDTTSASWDNGSAGSCWIDFTAHESVDLTTSDDVSAPYPVDTVLESTDNTMTVNSNSKDGVTVKVEVTGTSAPSGFTSNVLDGFRGKASTSSDQFSIDNRADSYRSLPSIGTKGTVGESSNPAKFDFSVSYKYTIDNKDIAGNYSVSLQYTVSSN